MKRIRFIFLIVLMQQFIFSVSLYQSKNPITGSLFSDRRARKVGDIITVIISESTTSSQSGKTALSKQSKVDSQIKSLFFSLAAAPGSTTNALFNALPYLGTKGTSHNGQLPSSEWESEGDFEGDGELSSSNTLNASMTAMIVEVLPNGNFVIEGKREVSIEGEKKTIIISGMIRSMDVGADNSILSKYIADAKILVEGEGPITKYRKRGALQKVWDFLGFE